MKAMVVGAGIAGLVAARQLGLADWDVEVLEKSPAPRPGWSTAGSPGLPAGTS